MGFLSYLHRKNEKFPFLHYIDMTFAFAFIHLCLYHTKYSELSLYLHTIENYMINEG